MDIWTQRLILAQQGWHTEARITRSGIGNPETGMRAFRIWAKRIHWQGWIADICLHDGCIASVDTQDMEGQIAVAVSRLFDVCQLAQSDFSHTVPCLAHPILDDQPIGLVESTWERQHVKEKQDKFIPTEDLPDDVSHYAANPNGLAVRAMIDAAREGFYVEDAINTYFGPGRYAGDCQNRPWGFRTRLAYDDLSKTDMAFQPREFSSDDLDEELCATLLTSAAASMTKMRTRYHTGEKQGATHNGLPSGYLTREEFDLNRRARKRKV